MTRSDLVSAMAKYIAYRGESSYSVLGDHAADCALRAIEDAGFVVVPAIPTLEMEIIGTEQWLCEAAMEDRAKANYLAMIEAGKIQP